MIEYMERHPELINDVAENSYDMWLVLVALLNNNNNHKDGAVKTVRAWKRTWTDLISTS
ncbi:hypothetical protein TSAR_000024, partial [Trichomalopsis sarcophagae]